MIDWRRCFPTGTPVAALPPWGRARLWVPRTGAPWRASAHYPATRATARAARLAARLGLVLGLARWGRAGGLDGLLAAAIGDEREVRAIIPGTPGPAAKATLVLADTGGRITAFLKVGTTPAARRRLRQERDVLPCVPAGLAPPVLDFLEDDGMTLLLLRAVGGEPLPWRRRPPVAVRIALEALHTAPPRPAMAHPWLRAVLAEAGPAGQPWGGALERRDWPVALRHGDLLYGHILVEGGGLRLIDWEYGVAEGFPWVDFAHLLLQTAALLWRASPDEGRRHAMTHLIARPWPGLDSREAAAIVGVAAFAAWRDGTADGHPETAPLQGWRRAVWTATA